MERGNIRIVIILLCCGCLSNIVLSAAPREHKKDWFYHSRANTRTGLYADKVIRNQIGLDISLDGLYYYGDVEHREKFPLNDYFTAGNLGGALTISCLQPVHPLVGMRYSFGGGFLRGSDMQMFENPDYFDKTTGTYTAKAHGKFNNIYVKGAVGVECYPIVGYDFYIYGGVQMNLSFIEYNYGPYNNGTPGKLGGFAASNADTGSRYFAFNPQVALEAGYRFYVSGRCQVGVHLGVDMNVVDTYISRDGRYSVGMSLDARPSPEAALSETEMTDGAGYLGISVTCRFGEESR